MLQSCVRLTRAAAETTEHPRGQVALFPHQVMWADLFGAWDFGDKLRINKNAHCDLPK